MDESEGDRLFWVWDLTANLPVGRYANEEDATQFAARYNTNLLGHTAVVVDGKTVRGIVH
jgi:hypothetical protein